MPDAVRRYALGGGHAAWLDDLSSSRRLRANWSLFVGATLHGGHSAFVAEVTTSDDIQAVLKVAVSSNRRELGCEATVLRLVKGDGCAVLLSEDLDRGALLLERLGSVMYEAVSNSALRQRPPR